MQSIIEQTDFFKGNKPEDIAKQYGTPVYVYNEDILRDRMRKVSKVITKYEFHANYSIKSNTNLHILEIALSEGLYADAMSIGEMKMLQKAGFPTDKIFFVPNNVSKEELMYAIDNGIMVSLDSLSQLELYGQLNPGGKCAVRINPGIGAGHHEKVVTAGKKTKFAVAEEDIDKIVNTYMNREEIEKYSSKVSIEEIKENDFNLNIPRYVDSFEEEEDIDLEEVSKKIKEITKEMKEVDKDIKKYCEELGIDAPIF